MSNRARLANSTSVIMLIAVALMAAGCSGSHHATAVGCSAKPGSSGPPSVAPVTSSGQGAASAWTQPGANPQNTRDVASAITTSNLSTLGVAWCVPVESTGLARHAHFPDGIATTPVIAGGVVYLQDLESNVMAIRLATGRVLWTHNYSSPNGGPDGVNVVGGTVYAATDNAAVALSAATGKQLWSRKLIGNNHEGIDMAPGYNDGTVYVSTVPVDPTVGQYLGGGKSTLFALNGKTGAEEWSWDEVQNLWGNPAINSGGGLWDPPSFDSQGNLYIGIANPGPIGQTGWPKGFPWGTSRPGPDLYTDSIVKLSPQGKLLWYYQLTPHDLFDWDLQNSPVLTTANGKPVVVDGGKAGIMIELDAQTGKLLWKRPVGIHSGPANEGLLTEHDAPASRFLFPSRFFLEPGVYGGVESQLASDGSTAFAAVNDLGVPMSVKGVTESSKAFEASVANATGEMVAVNQDTGMISWDDKLPSAPYGAATLTNNVVFTTTYNGFLYAFNAATGSIVLNIPLSAGSNSPVTVNGDYVIVCAGNRLHAGEDALIIAYKLGAKGHLPDKVRAG